MKKILFPTLILFSCIMIPAQEIQFRSGKVLAAEASSQNPGTENLKAPGGIWVQLIVKLTPGRKLSIYDYVLIDRNGKTYPCLGVAENDDVCSAKNWNIASPAAGALYRMIFKIPDFSGKNTDYQLKMVLRESKLPPAKIRIVKKNSYTPVPELIRKTSKTERNAH